MLGGMADVTQILTAAAAGDPKAAAELLPLVYDELRKLAAARLADERPGQTLAGHGASSTRPTCGWSGPGSRRTGAAAGTSSPLPPRPCAASWSRQPAARPGAARGWPPAPRIGRGRPLDGNAPRTVPGPRRVLIPAGRRDPQAARLVSLHCFAGLSVEQAAAALGVSARTAYRDWAFAQAWLYREVNGAEPPAEN